MALLPGSAASSQAPHHHTGPQQPKGSAVRSFLDASRLLTDVGLLGGEGVFNLRSPPLSSPQLFLSREPRQ